VFGPAQEEVSGSKAARKTDTRVGNGPSGGRFGDLAIVGSSFLEHDFLRRRVVRGLPPQSCININPLHGFVK
jgi:hypothetical protein